ncbi:hypothetical protein SCP_0110890 [Sparassis crispa]|uniref:Mediator of RNA polymerase II transcription subunit 5 n=1 Tax=Sparassis crispa TaxID=139825 RepID=A0A401G7R1_9APHY|nr:hypothetical protein SCP_0110890 [Sparassis crispa]GBE78206.1 hypothetical protein SCP_0110890 [Sparassis crispa]
MSLSELTRNSFQSGIQPAKWINLCKLFTSKRQLQLTSEAVQMDLGNSVLLLFRSYPGDPALQAYLNCAIQDQILSLPIFVVMFLSAAKSQELHNTATLDILCRVILDAHYASGSPPIGSVVSYAESSVEVLGTVQDAMTLLKTAYSLPTTPLHQLTTSASELLILLLSCVTDVSQISTAQAMMYFAEASEMLQVLRLSSGVKRVLESFALSLSLLLGDDAKVAREAQMMHTLLALSKGDRQGPGSDTDTITCSLVLHSLILSRSSEYGSGDPSHVAAILLGLLRWSSWTPVVFYTQLLLSALTCLAQNLSLGSSSRSGLIWRAFVVGRLPFLMSLFQQAAELDGTAGVDWRTVLQLALLSVLQHTELLDKCDSNSRPGSADSGERSAHSRLFVLEFFYQLLAVGLIDSSFATTVSPTLPNEFHPKLQSEAQDAGLDLASYFEAKLSVEVGVEDAVFLERTWKDPTSHAALAETVHKRFTSPASLDIESLSHLCRILSANEPALDILSLHIKIPQLVTHALAYVDDYDFETIGDPQAAVSHLGDVLLFLQSTIVRFNLLSAPFVLGGRALSPEFLFSAATIYRLADLKGEDLGAFNGWFKALFDINSEGIEDTILRATRPKTLLRISATLFCHAIGLCSERKMDKDVLNSGISYFLGPLLNWTLLGIVKALLAEIHRRRFMAPIHLEVLQTVLNSQSCPPVVRHLSAPAVLRLFPSGTKLGLTPTIVYDPSPIRRVALQALGLPVDDTQDALSLNTHGPSWADQPRHAVRDALSAARAGKAPSLDVTRCLVFTTPTKFLNALWDELMTAATIGDVEAPTRVATFVLTMPRCPRSPPLLPIFLHVVLPTIVASADHLASSGRAPPDQTITIELLVSVISSALTAALHLEWALVTVCGEKRFVLGQSVSYMARRLAGDLRRKGHGETSAAIMQRLVESQPFMANFPTFSADL